MILLGKVRGQLVSISVASSQGSYSECEDMTFCKNKRGPGLGSRQGDSEMQNGVSSARSRDGDKLQEKMGDSGKWLQLYSNKGEHSDP